jgi:hypothetical protein
MPRAGAVLRRRKRFVELEYSLTPEPRNGWRRTVALARLQALACEAKPSLTPALGNLIAGETIRGIEYAIADIEDPLELNEIDAQILRRARHMEEQVLGEWFPVQPR